MKPILNDIIVMNANDSEFNGLSLTPDYSNLAFKRVKEMQDEFLKLKFGMFIHYNMATYKGVEWVEGYADPSTFDPGGPVDTDEIGRADV